MPKPTEEVASSTLRPFRVRRTRDVTRTVPTTPPAPCLRVSLWKQRCSRLRAFCLEDGASVVIVEGLPGVGTLDSGPVEGSYPGEGPRDPNRL